jgi:3-hydroxyacyl-[acyl-carrier-protein] dehydratase
MRLEYFEMIDHVDEIDADAGTIRATARLPENSPVFDGHFPGFATLPGVMMLEMINHATGYILIRRFAAEKFVFLGGVRRAKFRKFLRPGTLATITSRLTHDGSGYAVAEGTLSADGEAIAEAEITMIITEFPSPELRSAFERLYGRLVLDAPVGA